MLPSIVASDSGKPRTGGNPCSPDLGIRYGVYAGVRCSRFMVHGDCCPWLAKLAQNECKARWNFLFATQSQ